MVWSGERTQFRGQSEASSAGVPASSESSRGTLLVRLRERLTIEMRVVVLPFRGKSDQQRRGQYAAVSLMQNSGEPSKAPRQALGARAQCQDSCMVVPAEAASV